MISQEDIRQIESLLENARTIFVMVTSDPSIDQLASAVAIHQALQTAGKDARLYSPEIPRDDFDLEGADAIKTEVGNQNLTISFDYSEEAVDKVSYHIGEETNKFYLTIKPKKGAEPLSTDSVEFAYTGAEADLVFVIGAVQLESLEQLYFGYENLYRDTPVVSINSFPATYGTVKLSTSGAGSMSEMVAKIIQDLGIALNSEAATNLLRGIDWATDSFQSFTATAETFEMAAALMRSGARRIKPQDQLMREPVEISGFKDEEELPQSAQEITVQAEKRREPLDREIQSKQRKSERKDKKSQRGGLDFQPSKDVSSK